jgi:hypothetical protein
VKYSFATISLAIAALLTLWLIKIDRGIPGHYTRWGELNMLNVFLLLIVRWFVLTGAFIALLRSGELNAWASWGCLRVSMVIAGLLALEICSFGIHHNSLATSIKPQAQTVFAILALLLPVCVIASGFFASRALFILGVAGALLTSIVSAQGERTFLAVKRPYFAENLDMPALLQSANPMYEPAQLQELFSRIEQRPNWIAEAATFLDGPHRAEAMYVLCRQPARLDEALQERCWATAGAVAAAFDEQLKEFPLGVSNMLQLTEAVKGLAALPGPLRDRHRAEFPAACDVIDRGGKGSSQVPNLRQFDWTGK